MQSLVHANEPFIPVCLSTTYKFEGGHSRHGEAVHVGKCKRLPTRRSRTAWRAAFATWSEVPLGRRGSWPSPRASSCHWCIPCYVLSVATAVSWRIRCLLVSYFRVFLSMKLSNIKSKEVWVALTHNQNFLRANMGHSQVWDCFRRLGISGMYKLWSRREPKSAAELCGTKVCIN